MPINIMLWPGRAKNPIMANLLVLRCIKSNRFHGTRPPYGGASCFLNEEFVTDVFLYYLCKSNSQDWYYVTLFALDFDLDPSMLSNGWLFFFCDAKIARCNGYASRDYQAPTLPDMGLRGPA
jgi:hypothetical protein